MESSKEPEYTTMVGATKKDGKTLIASVSMRTGGLNKTEALRLYSEWAERLNEYQGDGWTSGIAQVFESSEHLQGETIVEKRFGYQEENEVEDDNDATKKAKEKVRRSNKKRNLGHNI